MSRVRHVVLFRWKPEVTPEHIVATGRALADLPRLIPEIASYSFGPNLGINPGTYDFAVVAEFANETNYLVYRDHPDHKAFIAKYTADFVSERAAIQFSID
jgi:hypothetical protein